MHRPWVGPMLKSDVTKLVTSLGLGSRDDRARIRRAVDEFCRTQGYTADLGSFRNGVLTLHAAPAEHALLRYDLDRLRSHLERRGLATVVRDVKVRTRVLELPKA